MKEVTAKTILSKVKNGDAWFGYDYNMNLYRGCSHGCIYCDSRSECYGVDDFDTVSVKTDAINILAKELASKRTKGVIGIGAMSDTYNPFEKDLQVTRQALDLIRQHNFGVSITTKSPMITRDIDLLKQINEHNNVCIGFTITTPDDELSKIIEPNVAVSSERFAALKQIADQGIYCGVLATPTLPFITDNPDDIVKLVELAHQAGAKFIFTMMSVTLRDRQRTYYYQKLDQLFPNLKQKYQQLFGGKYVASHNASSLYKVFVAECNKYGIAFKMRDIIKQYKKSNSVNFEQQALF